MWHDIEAKVDLLNFNVVAVAAGQLVRDSGGQPLTIGISGGWGVGKSSLVKMIGATLSKDNDSDKKYVFLEFNAWLYQGLMMQGKRYCKLCPTSSSRFRRTEKQFSRRRSRSANEFDG